MAYRDVTFNITIKVKAKIDEGTELDDVVSEMEYGLTDQTGNATIEDTEVVDYEVVDSK